MGEILSQRDTPGLEGLCGGPPRARFRPGRGAPGIARLEAALAGVAFAPHRHDSYAIGITLAGVQRFRYRGAMQHCLPGQCHVLHPDELHDGAPGTEAGFRYRILYLDPALVQQALPGRPLPFVADPVLPGARLPPGLRAAIALQDDPLDDLERLDIVAAAAALLASAAGFLPGAERLHLPALLRVRTLLATHPTRPHSAAELEALSGLDRWTLARQFRAAFGTSPSRFRTLRQLGRARRLIAGGTPLAAVALACGFADQSHMTRQFKRAYGITPARWAGATFRK